MSDLGEGLSKLSDILNEAASDKMYAPTMGINEFEFPMEVKDFMFGGFGVDENLTTPTGTFVAIRPVAEEHENKTFLGIMLGDFPIAQMASFRPSTGKMTVVSNCNPAIYVPDLKKVVFGFESWWGPIKDENHLRQITDEDIENTWYVKAIKEQLRCAENE